jgi:hypothetical protein
VSVWCVMCVMCVKFGEVRCAGGKEHKHVRVWEREERLIASESDESEMIRADF